MSGLLRRLYKAAAANPWLNLAAAVFIIAEGVLAVLIQLTEYELYEALAYASVALAALFCLLSAIWSRQGLLIRAGLGVTLVADYFMILCEPVDELAGVLFFSLVQTCYFLALLVTESPARRKLHLTVRLVTVGAVLALVPAVLGGSADALSVCSAFYYANLLVNALFALTAKGFRLFGAGLVLFALCDATLGLAFIGSEYLHLTSGPLYELNRTALNVPWLFYVPSQTLIALSPLARGRK